MSTLGVVDCEAPFGVGAPSVGDMTGFGAVDLNALRGGRVETFHGTDCSEGTFRQFREWLDPRMPVVFVSDNPAYDFSGSTSISGATPDGTRSGIPDDALPTSTRVALGHFQVAQNRAVHGDDPGDFRHIICGHERHTSP